MTVDPSAIAATAGGGLPALPILLPAFGVPLSFLIGGRRAEWIALVLMPLELAVAVPAFRWDQDSFLSFITCRPWYNPVFKSR